METRGLSSKCKNAFTTGYSIRCIYGLYLGLKSMKKSQSPLKSSWISAIQQLLITRDHFKFGLTLSAGTATYHLLHRALSSKSSPYCTSSTNTKPVRIDKKELSIRLLAVTVSILWFKSFPKEFRDSVVLHLFVRAVYDVIKMWKYDKDYGFLPHIPNDEAYVGAAALTVVGYCIYHNPWLFDESFYRFILKWGSNTHEQIGNVFRSKSDPMSSV